MNHLSLIVAVSRNGVIGANGKIPWHLPEDLKYFKRTTLGHAVIMGRKTYESIGKPLPGRRNIVITRRGGLGFVDLHAVNTSLVVFQSPDASSSSLEDAIVLARETDPAPFIIGGAAVYAEALPLVDRMYITEVHRDADGDVLFPAFDLSRWNEVSRTDTTECSWKILERVS